MEITKGKWEVNNKLCVQANANDPVNTTTICQVFGKEEDHAILIADAGNTYQETNKLPSELAEANKELLNLLTHIRDASHIQITGFEWTEIDELIKKHSHA